MWELNVAINTVKAALPLRGLLRRLVRAGRGYPITVNAPLALSQGVQQIDDLRALGIEVTGRTVLDLGSGWHPIVPLLYRVAGASAVHLTDTDRLMDAQSLAAATNWVASRAPEIAARLGLAETTVSARCAAGDGTFDQMLERLNMAYHAPFEPAKAPTVDIVASRVVLEHIEPGLLVELHHHLAAALRPGGVVAHVIDNSDHREHRDKRLGRVDFLRYQDRTWRLLCLNPQDYCNRLRHSDHGRIMREAGFELLLNRGEVDAKALSDASAIPLAEPWLDRAPEDLATVTSWLIGRVANIAG